MDNCPGDDHFKMLWCTEQLLFLWAVVAVRCLAGTRLSNFSKFTVPWSVSAHSRAACVLLELLFPGRDVTKSCIAAKLTGFNAS